MANKRMTNTKSTVSHPGYPVGGPGKSGVPMQDGLGGGATPAPTGPGHGPVGTPGSPGPGPAFPLGTTKGPGSTSSNAGNVGNQLRHPAEGNATQAGPDTKHGTHHSQPKHPAER